MILVNLDCPLADAATGQRLSELRVGLHRHPVLVGDLVEADAAANFVFCVDDFNGDGIADLFCLKVNNTGTGRLEVHILDGATNFQTFLLQTGTPIAQADAAANLAFAVGDFNQDGALDLALVTGRVSRRGPPTANHWDAYAERNQVRSNDGAGRLRDISESNPALCASTMASCAGPTATAPS